ncbi:type IIL restriction-modification enzyme MmeI [Exiguobacterium aurantiacum]|uniref:type IIL restriction-modification enzyme MmeI n=1 Tax=Exiguobacterium aurantiacum TaxID=33987 RepID=UPI0034CED792
MCNLFFIGKIRFVELKAYKKLDKAVDKCYKTRKSLETDLKRLTLLFELYTEIVIKK